MTRIPPLPERWSARIPKTGVINVPDDDEVSEVVEWCLIGSSPTTERCRTWHRTWREMTTLPAWDIPFWTGKGIDVQKWTTPDEYANFLAWNAVTCYIYVNRLTAGIRPTEESILSLLTSSKSAQTPLLLDATDSHILRVKTKLELFVFDYLDGVSAWKEQPREPVDYPEHGLLETLSLIRANFNDAHDTWLHRMHWKHEHAAVRRAANYNRAIKKLGLMTSAKTLARMG